MHEFRVGDRVRLKKPHACGGDTWEVLFVGADVRLRCTTCGRILLLPRWKLERKLREVVVEGKPLPPSGR
ncbi:MAG: DUF951 domain-containing protein [Brockia lithotrophica]|nr:DUF951 domain-containing protein [Brockia lithotrophica]MBT9252470.1 DUF951 domain-containing protein [Brockia lithotrophica]